jgi:hypothetical protein
VDKDADAVLDEIEAAILSVSVMHKGLGAQKTEAACSGGHAADGGGPGGSLSEQAQAGGAEGGEGWNKVYTATLELRQRCTCHTCRPD